ncbi:MAG: thioredoxin domain-containing protein, partial [Deltaproteobacteria bacterium]|nr:thioredoxin domain-containing protein [Deltaproteobacteria bacterium]
FLLDQGRTPEGKLLHMWRRGQPGLAATAADYAFLTWGLLELYGWDFDPGWLGLALELTEDMTAAFRDEKLGGFYLTAEDKESFLPRIKESIDTALPSSNAVSMLNLLKLSRLTGNHLLEERAGGISSLLSSSARERPPAYPMFLAGLEFALAPSQEVVIVGRRDSPDTKEMLQRLRTGFFPNAVVLFKPADENDPAINRYANFVQFMAAPDNRATAYVCTDFKCNFPTTDPAKMIESLRAIPAKTPRE